MELLVFRHGPAEDRDASRWPDDRRRPLTDEGRRATERAARGLRALECRPGRVLTSPATRARATAEILRKELRVDAPLAEWEELAPEAPAAPILERLHRWTGADPVAVVGHEPTLGELVGLAVTGDAVPITRLTRAGAILLAFPREARPGAAQIDWAVPRKVLGALDGG